MKVIFIRACNKNIGHPTELRILFGSVELRIAQTPRAWWVSTNPAWPKRQCYKPAPVEQAVRYTVRGIYYKRRWAKLYKREYLLRQNVCNSGNVVPSVGRRANYPTEEGLQQFRRSMYVSNNHTGAYTMLIIIKLMRKLLKFPDNSNIQYVAADERSKWNPSAAHAAFYERQAGRHEGFGIR